MLSACDHVEMPASDTPAADSGNDPLLAAIAALDAAREAADHARIVEKQEIAEATARARAKRERVAAGVEEARKRLAEEIAASALGAEGRVKRKQVEIAALTKLTKQHVQRIVAAGRAGRVGKAEE